MHQVRDRVVALSSSLVLLLSMFVASHQGNNFAVTKELTRKPDIEIVVNGNLDAASHSVLALDDGEGTSSHRSKRSPRHPLLKRIPAALGRLRRNGGLHLQHAQSYGGDLGSSSSSSPGPGYELLPQYPLRPPKRGDYLGKRWSKYKYHFKPGLPNFHVLRQQHLIRIDNGQAEKKALEEYYKQYGNHDDSKSHESTSHIKGNKGRVKGNSDSNEGDSGDASNGNCDSAENPDHGKGSYKSISTKKPNSKGPGSSSSEHHSVKGKKRPQKWDSDDSDDQDSDDHNKGSSKSKKHKSKGNHSSSASKSRPVKGKKKSHYDDSQDSEDDSTERPRNGNSKKKSKYSTLVLVGGKKKGDKASMDHHASESSEEMDNRHQETSEKGSRKKEGSSSDSKKKDSNKKKPKVVYLLPLPESLAQTTEQQEVSSDEQDTSSQDEGSLDHHAVIYEGHLNQGAPSSPVGHDQQPAVVHYPIEASSERPHVLYPSNYHLEPYQLPATDRHHGWSPYTEGPSSYSKPVEVQSQINSGHSEPYWQQPEQTSDQPNLGQHGPWEQTDTPYYAVLQTEYSTQPVINQQYSAHYWSEPLEQQVNIEHGQQKVQNLPNYGVPPANYGPLDTQPKANSGYSNPSWQQRPHQETNLGQSRPQQQTGEDDYSVPHQVNYDPVDSQRNTNPGYSESYAHPAGLREDQANPWSAHSTTQRPLLPAYAEHSAYATAQNTKTDMFTSQQRSEDNSEELEAKYIQMLGQDYGPTSFVAVHNPKHSRKSRESGSYEIDDQGLPSAFIESQTSEEIRTAKGTLGPKGHTAARLKETGNRHYYRRTRRKYKLVPSISIINTKKSRKRPTLGSSRVKVVSSIESTEQDPWKRHLGHLDKNQQSFKRNERVRPRQRRRGQKRHASSPSRMNMSSSDHGSAEDDTSAKGLDDADYTKEVGSAEVVPVVSPSMISIANKTEFENRGNNETESWEDASTSDEAEIGNTNTGSSNHPAYVDLSSSAVLPVASSNTSKAETIASGEDSSGSGSWEEDMSTEPSVDRSFDTGAAESLRRSSSGHLDKKPQGITKKGLRKRTRLMPKEHSERITGLQIDSSNSHSSPEPGMHRKSQDDTDYIESSSSAVLPVASSSASRAETTISGSIEGGSLEEVTFIRPRTSSEAGKPALTHQKKQSGPGQKPRAQDKEILVQTSSSGAEEVSAGYAADLGAFLGSSSQNEEVAIEDHPSQERGVGAASGLVKTRRKKKRPSSEGISVSQVKTHHQARKKQISARGSSQGSEISDTTGGSGPEAAESAHKESHQEIARKQPTEDTTFREHLGEGSKNYEHELLNNDKIHTGGSSPADALPQHEMPRKMSGDSSTSSSASGHESYAPSSSSTSVS